MHNAPRKQTSKDKDVPKRALLSIKKVEPFLKIRSFSDIIWVSKFLNKSFEVLSQFYHENLWIYK